MDGTEVEGAPVEPESRTSRRGFLAGAAGLTGVALAVTGWDPVFAAGASGVAGGTSFADAANKRGTLVSSVELLLDEGVPAGFLQSAEGGRATSDVVNEKIGPDHIVHKHIAGVKYEDITVGVGVGMDKRFSNWIQASFTGSAQRHSGAVVAADFSLAEVMRLDFQDAFITEVSMPALDAASKDAAKVTVKFTPTITRRVTPGGKISNPGGNLKLKWTAGNFKLTLNGLDTSKVVQIDALTMKQTVGFNPDSEAGGLVAVDFANFKLKLAESSGDTWWKWHEDFVIKGNSGSENEKVGSLSYLATDLKTEVFRLDLSGVGIFALDPDPFTATATPAVRHLTASLYIQKASWLGPRSVG